LKLSNPLHLLDGNAILVQFVINSAIGRIL
jgi:hypothetical protein